MLENRVKKKIAAGETAYGVMVSWDCPDLVEFIGHLGYDWIFIDAEHGIIGPETCQDLARACNLSGMTPIVRVPDKREGTILRYLETGVQGVILPHINTADEASAAVEAIKYGPIGRRGAGSTTRAANYGLTQTPTEYFARANEQVMISAIIEDIIGIRNLDEILGIDGIDTLAVGSGDLAMSLGLPGQVGDPEVQRLTIDAEDRIVRAGKILDVVIGDAAGARESWERGSRMICISTGALLGRAARTFLADVQQAQA